ncbi:TRAP transporter substrate-binding protein [Pseudokordiimonas caeni]|uniref:TRAP transporter substrate-binding protein n=1 Tax=Pseudokordiimonas caeni TaxID=2997908 RepID=UPI0028121F8B|nr:TRAP transporter substrate-binding protein [Pseudokordiimonas caeni]
MLTGLGKLGRAVLVAAAALLTISCEDSNRTTVLKLAHGLDTGHPVHMAMLYMGKELRALSHGTMDIDVFPNAQLGSERETLELLQIGSLAIAKVSAAPLEGFVPEMKLFSIPYLFRDEDHYWRVLEGPVGQHLLKAGENVRLHGLVFYNAGSRSFYTTKVPVRSPADLKGLKIRVMNSQTAMRMVDALGGNATPIAYPELYTALQQGVVDGAENNPPSFFTSKHYDVAPYFTLDRHAAVPDVLLMSKHVWDNLTPEQQGWVTEAAARSVPYQRQLWDEATEEALSAMRAAGVEIIEPDVTAFQAAVQEMHESFRDDPVYPLMQQIAETP